VLFREPGDAVEHAPERGARGDLLEQPALADGEQLGPLPLGLVGERAGRAGGLAPLVEDAAGLHLHPAEGTVARQVPDFVAG
jgi:hypothetical protein